MLTQEGRYVFSSYFQLSIDDLPKLTSLAVVTRNKGSMCRFSGRGGRTGANQLILLYSNLFIGGRLRLAFSSLQNTKEWSATDNRETIIDACMDAIQLSRAGAGWYYYYKQHLKPCEVSALGGRYDYPSHPSPLLQKPNTKGERERMWRALSLTTSPFNSSTAVAHRIQEEKPLPFPLAVLRFYLGFSRISWVVCNLFAAFFDCAICEGRLAPGVERASRD